MKEKTNPFEVKRTHTIIFPTEDFNDYIIKEEGQEGGKDYTRLFKRVNKDTSSGLSFDTCFICKPIEYQYGTHRFDKRYLEFEVTRMDWSTLQWFRVPDGIQNEEMSPKIKILVKCCDEGHPDIDEFSFRSNDHYNTVTIITNLSTSLFDELFSLLLKDKHLDVSIRVNLTSVEKELYFCREEVTNFVDSKSYFKMISSDTKFTNSEEEIESLPEFFLSMSSSVKGQGVEFFWSKLF